MKRYKLVVWLRTEEIKLLTKVLVTNVSGKYMITQGPHGVSRGFFKEGIALGVATVKFYAWGRSTLDIDENLIE